jgi:NTP pyrophosphatase (non-canonical NTP hydrolase)
MTLTDLSPDLGVASLLGHLPREARTLVVAVDRLRTQWATADDQQRQQLWNAASDVAETLTPLGSVLAEVSAERAAQDARWGVEDLHDWERISHLTEEVGELAKAANEANFRTSPTRGDRTQMREEAIQVAAVAVAIVQSIDRRTPASPSPA